MGGDFRRLLRLFESSFLGTFIAGSPRPFTRATPAEQDARLEAWRRSRFAVLRSGYQALKRLAQAAYYSSPEVYALIGYPGPPVVPAGAGVSEPRARPAASSPARSCARCRRRGRLRVVGSGAGGGVAAAVLAAAGRQGRGRSRRAATTRARDFNMQEAWAYPALYQEHGNRATDDLAIMILQGRNVGGGTTVNWTSSFRTPRATLRLWAERHGVGGLDAATLAPHFAAVEARLDIGAGNPDDVNANNRKLLGGRRASWAGTPS